MSAHVLGPVPFPRRMALCISALGAGLVISLAYGHVLDAIVIVVVMLPGIALLSLWGYVRRKTDRQQSG